MPGYKRESLDNFFLTLQITALASVTSLFGALSHTPQGREFDPQSGSKWELTDQCFSHPTTSCLSRRVILPLPVSLKKAVKNCPQVRINDKIKNKNKVYK